MIASRRWYLTEKGEVVQEAHPEAASLLVGKGCELHDVKAKKHGLMEKEAEAKEAEAKALSAPPANKAVASPPQTK